MDFAQHLYILAKQDFGMAHLIERNDCGVPEIRRRSGEDCVIGMRSIPVVDMEKQFSVVSNVSAGELLKKWFSSYPWPTSNEAQALIDRIIYIEDVIDFKRAEAADASPKGAIERAHRLAREAREEAANEQ
jgi:hypothetical protein